MNRIVLIEGIAVDLSGILSIAHRCDPTLCRERESCCAHYEICCAEDELPRLISLFPKAAEYVPALRMGEEFDNVFEETDDELFCFDADADGLCVFAYRDAENRALCSLHTAAEDLGMDPYVMKPRACLLWPLGLTADSPPYLSAHPDALRFPCNQRRTASPAELDPGIAEILRGAFGQAFYRQISEALGAPACPSPEVRDLG